MKSPYLLSKGWNDWSVVDVWQRGSQQSDDSDDQLTVKYVLREK